MSIYLTQSKFKPGLRGLSVVMGLAAACLLAQPQWTLADSGAPMTSHERMAMMHHMAPMPKTGGVSRSQVQYKIPAVSLTRSDGTQVRFPQELDDGRPVILDFVYTSCISICPILSQTLEQVQSRLGAEASQVRMVTVSIDPEQDTPAHLAEYARTFHAGDQWSFYTGTREASLALQKAFDVYRGDKMNHDPVIFLRGAPGQPWVRLDGFPPPDRVVAEYRQLAGAS